MAGFKFDSKNQRMCNRMEMQIKYCDYQIERLKDSDPAKAHEWFIRRATISELLDNFNNM